MRPVRILTAMALMGIACRIGGPTADPSAVVALPDDAGDGGASGGDDAGGADADLATVDAPPGPGVDAPADAPLDRGSQEDGRAGDGGDSGTCTPPATVPVCNPVNDTGCTLLQCDVDTSMSTPTGVCVLGSGTPTAENAACTQTAGSTPCQPDMSCVASVCRKVCFCDSDCTGGECCSDAYATTGFKLCGACR